MESIGTGSIEGKNRKLSTDGKERKRKYREGKDRKQSKEGERVGGNKGRIGNKV